MGKTAHDFGRKMEEALADFVKEHGHANVPQKHQTNPQLCSWLAGRRKVWRKGLLSPDEQSRLEALGVVWDPRAAQWTDRLSELVAYQAWHGHCDVPNRHPENPPLGKWVMGQRAARKQGRLSKEQVARLDALGFRWGVADQQWDDMLAELRAFHASAGHCRVSEGAGPLAVLGKWVAHQREARRRDELDATRVAKLDALGFSWNPQDEHFEAMLACLVAYKAKRGHCRLPSPSVQESREDEGTRRLCLWAHNLRSARRRGGVPEERVRRLDQLGFWWGAQG